MKIRSEFYKSPKKHKIVG